MCGTSPLANTIRFVGLRPRTLAALSLCLFHLPSLSRVFLVRRNEHLKWSKDPPHPTTTTASTVDAMADRCGDCQSRSGAPLTRDLNPGTVGEGERRARLLSKQTSLLFAGAGVQYSTVVRLACTEERTDIVWLAGKMMVRHWVPAWARALLPELCYSGTAVCTVRRAGQLLLESSTWGLACASRPGFPLCVDAEAR